MSLALRPQGHVLRDSNENLTMSTNRIVKNQIVFRVKDSRKPTPRARRPAPLDKNGTPAEHVVHARRPHRKSRTGCGNCKRRRVKCDENKPRCKKCDAYGISCDYVLPPSQASQPSLLTPVNRCASNPGSIDASVFTMSLADVGNMVLQVLRSATAFGTENERLSSFAMAGAPSAFHHFMQTAGTVGSMSKASKKVATGDMIRLAFQTPHLMHAILGVACASLYQSSAYDESHKLAEDYHWGNAIALYKEEIDKPGPHNMDGLMSTCMMMGVLSFSDKEYSPRNSWVFTDRPTDLNWLLVQSGLRYLIESFGPWLPQSIWWEFFSESDDENKTFDDHRPGRLGLHPELAELCDIQETTTEFDNSYHWPLRLLTPLLRTPMIPEHFSKFCAFMGRMLPDYINLLYRKDEKACLILAFWMGKMCEKPDWWMYTRMHAECTALCMYLENTADPDILKLLEYPASRCGYIVRQKRIVELQPTDFDFSGCL